MVVPEEAAISEYYERKQQLEELGKDFRTVITHPTYALPFLQPGRLVTVKHESTDFGWGIVVNFTKRATPKPKDGAPPLPAAAETPQSHYIVDVLLNCAAGSVVSKDQRQGATTVLPCPPGEKGEPLVVPVLLSTLSSLSHIRIFMPKDLRPLEGRQTAMKALGEVKKRFPDGIALLDPIENMGIKDDEFKGLVKVRQLGNPKQSRPRYADFLTLLCRKSKRSRSLLTGQRSGPTPSLTSCTRSTRPRWTRRRQFGRLRKRSRPSTMCSNSTSSSAASASFAGSASRRPTTSSR